jgi:hypothetical protein
MTTDSTAYIQSLLMNLKSFTGKFTHEPLDKPPVGNRNRSVILEMKYMNGERNNCACVQYNHHNQ